MCLVNDSRAIKSRLLCPLSQQDGIQPNLDYHIRRYQATRQI